MTNFPFFQQQPSSGLVLFPKGKQATRGFVNNQAQGWFFFTKIKQVTRGFVFCWSWYPVVGGQAHLVVLKETSLLFGKPKGSFLETPTVAVSMETTSQMQLLMGKSSQPPPFYFLFWGGCDS